MKYNYNYKNNNNEFAPYILISGNYQIINPTPEQYANAGYFPYEHDSATHEEINPIKKEIDDIQKELAKTDYINFKYTEGYDCDTLYPGWKEKRKALRDRINELEDLLKSQNALL